MKRSKARKREHSVSFKRKMTYGAILLISAVTAGICMVSVMIFSKVYYRNVESYISDITRQTKNNIESNNVDMDLITFDTLRNTTIQEQLVIANTRYLNDYERTLQSNIVENELASIALFNENIISLSVISLTGKEFTQQTLSGEAIEKVFDEGEIYAAKGSALWSVTDDGRNNICVARSIIHLKTQKPIGYINLICTEEYWSAIMNDLSATYTSGTYLVDKKGTVVSSNNKKYLGQSFPIWTEGQVAWGTFQPAKLDGVASYVYCDEPMENGWTLFTAVPLFEIRREINAFMGMCGILGAVVIGCSILLIHFFVDRMLKPMEELCLDIEAVGEGDFSARFRITTADEIGRLGTAYNTMAENIETLIEKVYKMEITQKQAEIEFLKMQINPHFLYNTLETISWMGRLHQQNDIADVTVALAALLRATIKQDSFIPVKEELQSVYNYILIQAFRFGNRIQVTYDIAADVEHYRIPNFILQPLIENSIIHGLEPKLGPGKLHLKISLEQEKLRFMIEDDGVGMSRQEVEQTCLECESEDSRHCIGIKNVYRRLKIYYGAEGSFIIESEKNKGTIIVFSIPIEENNNW